MAYRTDIVYLYDGSFAGLLCCVFESFYEKEMPFGIFSYDDERETLFSVKEIFTNEEYAGRVEASIGEKICAEALHLVRMCYLSRMEGRELAVLNFLRLGYKVGAGVVDMLSDEDVRIITKATNNVAGEGHKYKGLLRFSEYNGALIAIIEPKNFILPIIAPHFCDRFPSENFLIYDKTHKHAFVYQDGNKSLIQLDELKLPKASEEEKMYRALWKHFYDTIAIEGRKNPKLRMGHMPKRYWPQLTEFAD